jgi:hypothetical protein
MAEILCVYKEVGIVKAAAATSKEPSGEVAIISYDEKPGVQATAVTKAVPTQRQSARTVFLGFLIAFPFSQGRAEPAHPDESVRKTAGASTGGRIHLVQLR